MAGINEYIKYYSNYTFSENNFNDVDNLLFSEISYVNWDNIIFDNKKGKKLSEAISEYETKNKNQTYSKFNETIAEHVIGISKTKRFKDIVLSNYVSKINDEEQFSALTIEYEKGKKYVSFRGTDATIAGWFEDIRMSYSYPVPAQTDAIEYLNSHFKWDRSKLLVGGHSKGANLAMTAAMYCSESIKKRIKTVYDNDGPGFRETEFNSKEYQEMSKKLIPILPEDSVVGRLMYFPQNYKVVKSTEKNIMAHDITTWKCFGSFVEEGEFSEFSELADKKIMKIFIDYTDEEKEEMVTNFFGIFTDLGVKRLSDIKKIDFKIITSTIDKIKGIKPDVRTLYFDVFKDIIRLEKK